MYIYKNQYLQSLRTRLGNVPPPHTHTHHNRSWSCFHVLVFLFQGKLWLLSLLVVYIIDTYRIVQFLLSTHSCVILWKDKKKFISFRKTLGNSTVHPTVQFHQNNSISIWRVGVPIWPIYLPVAEPYFANDAILEGLLWDAAGSRKQLRHPHFRVYICTKKIYIIHFPVHTKQPPCILWK